MKDAQEGDSTDGDEADKPRVSLLRTWRCVGLRSSGIVSLNCREESSLGLSSLLHCRLCHTWQAVAYKAAPCSWPKDILTLGGIPVGVNATWTSCALPSLSMVRRGGRCGVTG